MDTNTTHNTPTAASHSDAVANAVPFMTFTYHGVKRVVINAAFKVTASGDVLIVGFETKRGNERSWKVKAYRADEVGK